jgi:hypothetical protein
MQRLARKQGLEVCRSSARVGSQGVFQTLNRTWTFGALTGLSFRFAGEHIHEWNTIIQDPEEQINFYISNHKQLSLVSSFKRMYMSEGSSSESTRSLTNHSRVAPVPLSNVGDKKTERTIHESITNAARS